MKAMLLNAVNNTLHEAELPIPIPKADEVLLKVKACGICRTDLHVIDGDLTQAKFPLILGHEIVGVVIDKGKDVDKFTIGQRLGVPWLGQTCGHCHHCSTHHENLCDHALFTGYTLDGGFAEYTVANQDYCFPLPDTYSDAEAAPLLCAGLIGYRALLAAGDAQCLGIYGFGAAAHIIAQVAHHQGRTVFAFTKPDDIAGQNFAMSLGVDWAGDSNSPPPQKMDAAIIFAPVGTLIPQALSHLNKGGTVVCAGIHMSDIPSFPYHLLWGERTICSIANLTRQDGEYFLSLAPKIGIHTTVQAFPLSSANEAINQLRQGNINGAAVLVMDE
jgi:alcohol dehydrogenase, propanol-preferring